MIPRRSNKNLRHGITAPLLIAGLLSVIFFSISYLRTSDSESGRQFAKETVDFEVVYRIRGIENVYIVWGVDNWQLVESKYWPSRTSIKNNTHHTTMVKNKNKYSITLQLPAGSSLQYGFFVQKKNMNGGPDTYIWDGDYKTTSANISHSKYLFVLENAESFRFLKYIIISTGVLFIIWIAFNMLTRPQYNIRRAIILFFTNVAIILIFLIGAEAYLISQNYFTLKLDPPIRYAFESNEKKGLVSHNVLGWVASSKKPDINRQGFRAIKDFQIDDRRSKKIRVMVLGDSFMWGSGVVVQQNLPTFLKHELGDNYEVFNLAIPGWGLGQMYAAYQMYKRTLDPDIVMLAYIDNDILRVLDNGKPNFTVHNGTLNFRNGLRRVEKILNSISDMSVVMSLGLKEFYYAPVARAVSAEIVGDILLDVERNGGEFLVVRIPVPERGKYQHSIMENWIGLNNLVESKNLRYIDLSEFINEQPNADENYYLNDPGTHFSKAGNRAVAEYLAAQIKGLENSKLLSDRLRRQARRSKLITAKVQYENAASVDQALLVWGVNGWQTVAASQMPPGSEIVDGRILTPMRFTNGRHEVTLSFPSGAIVDYNIKVVNGEGELILLDDNNDVDYHLLIK